MEKNLEKRRLIPNIHVGTAGMDAAALRQLAMNEPKDFMQKCNRLIDSGEMSWRKTRDVRKMFLALADVQVPCEMDVMGETRAVMASAFPLLAGGLTVAGINEAYEAVPTIGQELVTETDSNARVSVHAATTSLTTNEDRVDEGKEFPEISAGEEKYEIRSKRNGRRLSITAETIEENNVAGIVEKINSLAEIAGELVEEQTLQRVTDNHGSASSAAEPYAMHIGGTGTQLYNATANNPGARAPSGTRVNNNALVDGTDLDNARAVLAAMKNSRGRRIAIPMSRCILLVPDALAGVASKILNSELEPGVENEINNWGPRGQYRPRLVTSPKLDDLSTTAWYLGDFQKQFKRKWKLRFEYVTLAGDTQVFLTSRIAFQARIAWDVEVGAVDYVYVVQNLSTTAAPTAVTL